jgi:hypothetical protein
LTFLGVFPGDVPTKGWGNVPGELPGEILGKFPRGVLTKSTGCFPGELPGKVLARKGWLDWQT